MAGEQHQPYLFPEMVMGKKSNKNNKKVIHEDTFEPLQQLSPLRGSWWVLLIVMVAGAVIGYGAHFIFPPVYTSTGEISFSIDYTRTGALTDVEEDIAIVTVGDILSSTVVIQETIDAGKAAGLNPEDFVLEKTAFYERYNFKYSLVVENTDSETAVKWANLWLESAYQTLTIARTHALNATEIYNQIIATQQCIENSGQVLPVAAICQDMTQSELQELLVSTNEKYISEKEKSLAVLPALDFTISQVPEETSRPERRQTGILIFSGAILGAIIFLTWFFVKGNARRSH